MMIGPPCFLDAGSEGLPSRFWVGIGGFFAGFALAALVTVLLLLGAAGCPPQDDAGEFDPDEFKASFRLFPFFRQFRKPVSDRLTFEASY
jgi:hypothetical protein